MGADGATLLPVETGRQGGECKVWMRRLGPYLVASDNLSCGGMNISFTGVYTKSGAMGREQSSAPHRGRR